ncbi:MAG: hypothetical protein GY788_00820, partial [bacterium]|nr:hypothetical protein [bacterium]
MPVFENIDSGEASYLRITREDDLFRFEYSSDGDSWTTAISLTSDIVPTAVGPFGGSTTTDGISPPGFISQVDWFLSSSDPIVVEDNVMLIATDDVIETDVDTPLVINVATDLLGNDTDTNGNALSLVGFADPSHGTLIDNGDGTFTYTPTQGYDGDDSFTYDISNGAFVDTATVSLTVSPPPIPAHSDDFSSGVLDPVWTIEGPGGTSAGLATTVEDAF